MTNGCQKFGQGQDLLGKQVGFSYKGSPKYGTVCGGYVSLCARIFIWSLAAILVYSCFTEPVNVQQTKYNQLQTPNSIHYNIKIDEGLPTFYTYTKSKKSINDQDLFSFEFLSVESDPSSPLGYKNVTIAARPCDEVIREYVTDPVTQQNMLKEFNDMQFLCPDTDQYTIFVSAWQITGIEF